MKNIFKKINIFLLTVLITVGLFTPEASAIITNSNIYFSYTQADFDGVDEYFVSTGVPTYITDSKSGGKSVAFWFVLDSLLSADGARGFVNIGGTGGGTSGAFMNFGVRRRFASFGATTRLDRVIRNVDAGSTAFVNGSTNLSTGVNYLVIFQTNGSSSEMYLCAGGTMNTETITATVGSDTGQWFSDVAYTGSGRSSIGAVYRGGSATNFNDGKVGMVTVFNDDLTSDERTALCNGGRAISPFAVGLDSKVKTHYDIGGVQDGSSITTIHSVGGGNNMQSVNMEDADLTSSTYY